MITLEHSEPLVIPAAMVRIWQSITDTMSELLHIPAGLIMRTVEDDIEVFVASHSEGNPYHPGDKEHLCGSGLYCEHVIRTREKLVIPNALQDPAWDHNPDITLNMISYLGFPILEPDGHVFGTICVLDNQENAFGGLYERLLGQFKAMIEAELSTLHHELALKRANEQLKKQLEEIEALRGIIPICAHCKNMRDDAGLWLAAEQYVAQHSPAEFSHGICPACIEKYYPEYAHRLI